MQTIADGWVADYRLPLHLAGFMTLKEAAHSLTNAYEQVPNQCKVEIVCNEDGLYLRIWRPMTASEKMAFRRAEEQKRTRAARVAANSEARRRRRFEELKREFE
jgi:hypothetical protein